MELIGNIILKAFKLVGYVILRILMMSGLLLLVGNIMWLFYDSIGKGISNTFDFYMEKKTNYLNLSGALSQDILTGVNSNKLFIDSCDMGDAEGQGRFLMHFDKICLPKGTKAEKLTNGDLQNIYHEFTHYSLRNLPITKKLLIREKIVDQIYDIKNVLKNTNQAELSGDDLKYFKELSGGINKYASDSVYNFYGYTKDIIITYWGNEEYITYAMQFLMYIDKDKKPYFTKYELNNPKLKEIDSLYRQIFQDIGMIK